MHSSVLRHFPLCIYLCVSVCSAEAEASKQVHGSRPFVMKDGGSGNDGGGGSGGFFPLSFLVEN